MHGSEPDDGHGRAWRLDHRDRGGLDPALAQDRNEIGGRLARSKQSLAFRGVASVREAGGHDVPRLIDASRTAGTLPMARSRRGSAKMSCSGSDSSVPATIDGRDALEAVSLALLQAEMPVRRGVRLLGVSLSSLTAPTDGRPQMTFDV